MLISSILFFNFELKISLFKNDLFNKFILFESYSFNIFSRYFILTSLFFSGSLYNDIILLIDKSINE